MPRPPRRPQPPRKRSGRIQPNLHPEWVGRCYTCGRLVRGGLFYGAPKWGGKFWCWRHHPLRPHFHWQGWRSTVGTPARAIEKHQRKVDAILGHKKRKPAKPKKKPRDRRYVR